MLENLPREKYRIQGPLEVEFGDVMQPDPMPQVKVKRWSNEVNFSLRLQTPLDGVSWQRDGEKMIWQRGNLRALLHYRKDDPDRGDLFMFDTVMTAPPVSNVLTFTLRHKELRFLRQPPLTEDPYILANPTREFDTVTETEAWSADGKLMASRPAAAVGSYAVYHATRKDNQYGAGKAFHIYRPKITDGVGRETWGELNLDPQSNRLTVTIPPAWLADAVYPVTLDPDLGDTTVGASALNTENHTQLEYRVVSEDGTLNSISVHCRSTYAYSSKHFAAALFNATNPTTVGSLVHAFPSQVVPYNGASAAWEVFSYGGADDLVGGNGYWIATCGDSDPSSGESYLSYDSGGTGYQDAWRDVVDGLDTATAEETTTNEISAYATYTVSGGGGGPTTFPTGMMMGL